MADPPGLATISTCNLLALPTMRHKLSVATSSGAELPLCTQRYFSALLLLRERETLSLFSASCAFLSVVSAFAVSHKL